MKPITRSEALAKLKVAKSIPWMTIIESKVLTPDDLDLILPRIGSGNISDAGERLCRLIISWEEFTLTNEQIADIMIACKYPDNNRMVANHLQVNNEEVLRHIVMKSDHFNTDLIEHLATRTDADIRAKICSDIFGKHSGAYDQQAVALLGKGKTMTRDDATFTVMMDIMKKNSLYRIFRGMYHIITPDEFLDIAGERSYADDLINILDEQQFKFEDLSERVLTALKKHNMEYLIACSKSYPNFTVILNELYKDNFSYQLNAGNEIDYSAVNVEELDQSLRLALFSRADVPIWFMEKYQAVMIHTFGRISSGGAGDRELYSRMFGRYHNPHG